VQYFSNISSTLENLFLNGYSVANTLAENVRNKIRALILYPPYTTQKYTIAAIMQAPKVNKPTTILLAGADYLYLHSFFSLSFVFLIMQ